MLRPAGQSEDLSWNPSRTAWSKYTPRSNLPLGAWPQLLVAFGDFPGSNLFKCTKGPGQVPWRIGWGCGLGVRGTASLRVQVEFSSCLWDVNMERLIHCANFLKWSVSLLQQICISDAFESHCLWLLKQPWYAYPVLWKQHSKLTGSISWSHFIAIFVCLCSIHRPSGFLLSGTSSWSHLIITLTLIDILKPCIWI